MTKDILLRPIKVEGERAWRTYTGGKKIDQLMGKEHGEDSFFPELWILSTIQAVNAGREHISEGLCKVKIGEEETTLKDILKAYPNQALGQAHNEKFKGEMGVLVKLIDSKERLTIQVHPTREKAKQYFDSDYGKTECWHIVDTRADEGIRPYIYIGFKEHVTEALFTKAFEEQDLEGMLDMLYPVEVAVGDTFIIHGGIPHAIGAGASLIEIQEPTDYTLRVEKTTPGGYRISDAGCHQGIGVDKMMDCFNFNKMSLEDVEELCKINVSEETAEGYRRQVLIDYERTPFFKMDKLTIKTAVPMSSEEAYYGLFVVSGSGTCQTSDGETQIKAGDQFFISSICEEYQLKSSGEDLVVIQFMGPMIG